MRKRIISFIIIVMMVVVVSVPAMTDTAEASSTFTVRTSMPAYGSDIGLKWYYTNDNLYYKYNYAPNLKYLSSRKGYVRGNCTWYAYARASEIAGKWMNSAFRYSAYKWYSINKAGKYYPYGTTPKVGAVACYATHVAVVEKIVNGQVYVSESGWKIGAKPTTASQIYFHYGTPWYKKATGYIYVNEGMTSTDSTTTTTVNYKVSITSKTLNMRTGPGTSYTSKGYITPGTYTVTQESGNWGKLNNGYWVYLSYTTRISDSSSATSTTSTTAATTAFSSYQVKITTKTLNMRTGPSTSYKSKGYIKPGTYTIVSESNGWGKLSTNGYWIYLSYATKVNTSTTAATTTATTTATTSTTAATTAASTSAKFNVKISSSGVAMRTGASNSYTKKGTVTKGSTYGIKAMKKGWGQLSSNGYWINLKYATLSTTFSAKITASKLNMRTGASTSYKSKGYVKAGTYKVKAIKNGWCQLSSNGYWVSMYYINLV